MMSEQWMSCDTPLAVWTLVRIVFLTRERALLDVFAEANMTTHMLQCLTLWIVEFMPTALVT